VHKYSKNSPQIKISCEDFKQASSIQLYKGSDSKWENLQWTFLMENYETILTIMMQSDSIVIGTVETTLKKMLETMYDTKGLSEIELYINNNKKVINNESEKIKSTDTNLLKQQQQQQKGSTGMLKITYAYEPYIVESDAEDDDNSFVSTEVNKLPTINNDKTMEEINLSSKSLNSNKSSVISNENSSIISDFNNRLKINDDGSKKHSKDFINFSGKKSNSAKQKLNRSHSFASNKSSIYSKNFEDDNDDDDSNNEFSDVSNYNHKNRLKNENIQNVNSGDQNVVINKLSNDDTNGVNILIVYITLDELDRVHSIVKNSPYLKFECDDFKCFTSVRFYYFLLIIILIIVTIIFCI
jgi:hypothetical protein